MREMLVRLLAIQAVGGLLVAAFFCWYVGAMGGLSALYGVAAGLLVSLLLAWRLSQTARPGADLRGLYVGALERMVFVAAAFAVAFGWLGLAPLAVVAGFAGAELAYFAAAGPLRQYMLDIMGTKNNGR